MNINLTKEIVSHIMSNFGIIPSLYLDLTKTKSIKTKEFLLNNKLQFESEGKIIQNNIWGCQFITDNQEIKILLGDCAQDKEVKEYCLIINLKDSPVYGVYIVFDQQINEGFIGVSLNNKDWMECSTYLQATFLAGMEQIKDYRLDWKKCIDYQSQFEMMQNFIDYYNMFDEEVYAGQKD